MKVCSLHGAIFGNVEGESLTLDLLILLMMLSDHAQISRHKNAGKWPVSSQNHTNKIYKCYVQYVTFSLHRSNRKYSTTLTACCSKTRLALRKL